MTVKGREHGREELCFLDLPVLVLEKVLMALKCLRDICNCQRTCKDFYNVSKSNTIWNQLLYFHYGVNFRPGDLLAGMSTPQQSFQEVFRNLKEYEGSITPRFIGTYTDGGVKGDSPDYWIDNLFREREDHIHRSALGKNFNIVGLLVGHGIDSDLRRGISSERILRRYIVETATESWILGNHPELADHGGDNHVLDDTTLQQLLPPYVVGEGIRALEGWSTRSLVEYMLGLVQTKAQDSQAAPLFLRGLSEAQLTAEFRFCHDLASEFLQRDGKFSEFSRPQRLGESHEWLAEGVLATHRTHNHRRHSLGVISGMSIPRTRHVSNPVSTLVVFAVYLPHGTQAFDQELLKGQHVFKELASSGISKAFDDCSSLAALEGLCTKGINGKRLQLGQGLMEPWGRWIEFEPSPHVVGLKGMAIEPMLWLKFWSLEEARAFLVKAEPEEYDETGLVYSLSNSEDLTGYRDLEQEFVQSASEFCGLPDDPDDDRLFNWRDRGNQLDLEHPRGANALMVKLIDSENLMDASDELDGSIDITFVRCWGKYLEVTVDKIVGAPPQAHVDVGRAEYFADGHWMYK